MSSASRAGRRRRPTAPHPAHGGPGQEAPMGRPVLLTVDDDPAVSRAVARDLRRRYGETHRVLRAGSGAEALEALRELKLRGDPVAVLLADHRMPEMNGIELLEQAMDLVPRARRALLTAYADTDAAIAAINDVDVDAYLLKPWDPPDEKLYPTVDAMLAAWHDSPDPEVHGVKLVGHRWSAPSFRARDLLARNAVPYRWFNADEPDGQRILAAAGAGPDDVPVVVTADAQVLKHPGEAELAAVAGLAVDPREDFYDLVVVGGGPAGLGAAVYGASEGLRTVLVEREATGVDGVDDLTGRGVYYGSAMTEAVECTDSDGYVVGGANSAGQAAVFFSRYARSVCLLVRGPSLEASMSAYLIEQIAGIGSITVRTCTTVAGAAGNGHLEALTVEDARTGERETLPASHLFVFIGGAPRTGWLDGVVVRDERGFIPTGPALLREGRRPAGWDLDRDPYLLETSLPGVFVAGDVRADSVKRVASAVGEGAMAVTLVHRYLEER